MQFLIYALIALGIVAADQITKYLVVTNISLFEKVPFLPGLIRFTHTHNTGGAWSIFEGMRWLFILVFVAFTVMVIWEYFKKPMPFTKLERVCIACIYGGGLGNMIDRVRMGYVVDMIETEFIVFPVFNVADIFITCGSILLMVSLFFFNKAFWKEDHREN